jgi:polar amino acid transport system substrate-binding protein
MTGRRRIVAAALFGLAGLVAGCGSSSNVALNASLGALRTPAPQTSSSSTNPGPAGCTASLRPAPGGVPVASQLPPSSWTARIRKRKRLVAGVDQNTLGLAYANPLDGQRLEGFEIDLLHQISMELFGNPNRIAFRTLTTDERTTDLENGSVDIVVDAFTVTCKRAREFDFSSVYLNAAEKVLVPTSSKAKSIQDLTGKSICATKGSTTLAELVKDHPKVRKYVVAQRTDCLVALQRGKTDAIASDDKILDGYVLQDPYTRVLQPKLEPEPYGMAMSRAHPDFVRYVNAVLAKLIHNGTWARLYRKWLPGKPIPPQLHYRD